MEFLSNKPLLITDTILRDAHQSQAGHPHDHRGYAARLRAAGRSATTLWSAGAAPPSTPACAFWNEDPWERLRNLRKQLPHQKLQMLFRGQNMLGYRPYADDVVDDFCASPLKTASTSSVSSTR